jgi:hypothetical protein
MAKKIDPKAKAKKQKIIAAIGGVLLLGLLAFQVPRTMKMLHESNASAPSSTPAASTTTSASATAPIAAPSLSGGNATAAAVTGGDGLTDPDAVPPPQSGQLLAFGLFRTKDPFVQQLEVTCGEGSQSGSADSACSSGTSGSPKPSKPSGGGGQAAPANPPKAAPPGGTGEPAPPATAPASAVISINGTSETVQIGGQFPAADPVFALLALTKTTAKIAIAGGSLESGAPSLTLKKNKPLTLMNTADGTRYVLRLLSVS